MVVTIVLSVKSTKCIILFASVCLWCILCCSAAGAAGAAGAANHKGTAIMAKLPTGYLDMTRGEYDALDIDVQRGVYVRLREIVRYTLGVQKTGHAVLRFNPMTPVDWIMAIKAIEADCERCKGTGTYSWGASVNGKMTNSGPCARCGGDGRMTFDDMRRGKAYDNYVINRACRV